MAKRSTEERGPHPVDKHVGHRLRIRRLELGLSQSAVGDALGMTFQQVQKYERGANRVSASVLYELSRVLAVTTEYFFYGFAEGDESSSPFSALPIELETFLATSEGRRLSDALLTMPRHVRSSLVKLAAVIPHDADDDPDDPDSSDRRTPE